MKKLGLWLGLVFLCHGAAAQTVTVSAAASLKEALTELGARYQKTHPQTRFAFNFGSSGALQTQIENGAPVDIFIAAAEKNMDELAAQKLLDTATRRVLAANTLVLIVPRDSRLALRNFGDVMRREVRHIAIGGPAVPAGLRAQEVFTLLGIWQAVQAKAVRAKDVREALTQVELGNVEAGVVYGSDAASSRQVRVVATAPAGWHQQIRYPMAVLSGASQAAAAREFLQFLSGREAQAVLRRWHFLPSTWQRTR